MAITARPTAPPASRTPTVPTAGAGHDERHRSGGDEIDDGDEDRAVDDAEERTDHERKGNGADERAEVIGGGVVGDHLGRGLGGESIVQCCEQRHLGPDAHSDGERNAEQRAQKASSLAHVQYSSGAAPAEQREHDLDPYERVTGSTGPASAVGRADAHAEHRRSEHDRVGSLGAADGHRAEQHERQLVGDTGPGDDGRDEEQEPATGSAIVIDGEVQRIGESGDGGGNDERQADLGADGNARGRIESLFLHQLAEPHWQREVDDEEDDSRHQHAEPAVEHGIDAGRR